MREGDVSVSQPKLDLGSESAPADRNVELLTRHRAPTPLTPPHFCRSRLCDKTSFPAGGGHELRVHARASLPALVRARTN